MENSREVKVRKETKNKRKKNRLVREQGKEKVKGREREATRNGSDKDGRKRVEGKRKVKN